MAMVLIVDDEEANLYALRLVLESRGYNVFWASCGPEALRLAAENLPDAILLDIHMPVMDGYEVCRRLKADPRTTMIPIVFLTARHTDQEEIVRGLELGANDYITKPFNNEELLARVAVMVRVRTAEDKVRTLSQTDDLTGMYNRRYLSQRLQEEFARARRYGQTLACIVLDIDHFKKINDTYGHAAGDEALRQVAAIIRSHVRKSDLAVRYGGEEFLLVLFENDRNGALRVAERIRADVETRGVVWKNERLPVTVSSGVSLFPEEGITGPDELIARADHALYSAKSSGRNMVRAS
ncbi:MAG: diguanylate cyclase [Candidatus Polarisedimenticolia bacterium]